MPDPTRTLPAALLDTATRFPDRGIALLDGRGRELGRRTYPEIVDAVRTTASRWSARGLRPGDRVLVCLPTSWEWIDCWLGALWAGALPAAVAPGGAMGASDGHADKVAALYSQLGAKAIASVSSLADDLQQQGTLDAAQAVITPTALASEPGDAHFPHHPANAEETAFLQFTSGSTGLSRAVMIPHSAVAHNNAASDEAIGAPYGEPVHRWASGMVSWLPLHHDMGLVGCLFLSIHLGLDLWLFNPTAFLARPKLWLERLGQVGPTFAPAPNFGYQLCVERITQAQAAGIDLSHWRSAMTGAEMVRPETAAAFAELTAGCGFRPEAICPCYGLAEGTLAVTFDLRGQGIRTRPVPAGGDTGLGLDDVVSVGPPIRDTQIEIVAPDGTALPEGQVGEVRCKGPGIFQGYFNDEAATSEGLQQGWLCTGDLGFLHEGELYLTGRLKELLIIRGNNVMPHELEWLADQACGGGGSRRSGAFSISRSAAGEEAVLVMETTDRNPEALAEVAQAVRQKIGRALSLPLADLVFVRRGRIPKTTSGKVQRRALREQYLNGTLQRLDTA